MLFSGHLLFSPGIALVGHTSFPWRCVIVSCPCFVLVTLFLAPTSQFCNSLKLHRPLPTTDSWTSFSKYPLDVLAILEQVIISGNVQIFILFLVTYNKCSTLQNKVACQLGSRDLQLLLYRWNWGLWGCGSMYKGPVNSIVNSQSLNGVGFIVQFKLPDFRWWFYCGHFVWVPLWSIADQSAARNQWGGKENYAFKPEKGRHPIHICYLLFNRLSLCFDIRRTMQIMNTSFVNINRFHAWYVWPFINNTLSFIVFNATVT